MQQKICMAVSQKMKLKARTHNSRYLNAALLSILCCKIHSSSKNSLECIFCGFWIRIWNFKLKFSHPIPSQKCSKPIPKFFFSFREIELLRSIDSYIKGTKFVSKMICNIIIEDERWVERAWCRFLPQIIIINSELNRLGESQNWKGASRRKLFWWVVGL